MKYALAFLAVPLLLVGGFVVWACMTYSVVETARGGEYMLLKAEQAAECRSSGVGCGVFSGRELAQALVRLMIEQRGKPL